jgi:hypothetical protein
MKRKGFDLQARVAVTQLTQKKYSALQSAAPKAAPGRVPASKLDAAAQDIAQALRDMRDVGVEYHVGDSSVEVEVRLGRFLSKSTGLRFDYGRELYVLPSSKGTIQGDAAFEPGVAKEHYDRVQTALQRATTLGRLSCEHTAEEVYIYDTAERGTSNRLFVEGASQTPLAMQSKKSIREADACIFMPPPLSDCDARIGISVETELPSSRLPKTVPAGWGRRRQRDRYSYSVPGGAPGQAAAGWRVDLTSVVSTEQTGRSDQTYEVELEMQPEATETFLASGDEPHDSDFGEGWLVELSEVLWWGAPPCGVGRLAGLTVDNSMPMALLPSEPLPPPATERLLARCRAFCGGDPASTAASSFPGSVETALDRTGLRAMHEGPPAVPPCFLSARPSGHRYLLFLQGNGGGSGALGGEGAWLLAPDGRGFALLGAQFVQLAQSIAGSGPVLFDGHLCPVLAPSLRAAGFKAVYLITDLLAYRGEKLADEPFRRRYRKLVTEFVGSYRSHCGHPPKSTQHPMLLQAMQYFEARPPKKAPVWSYDLIVPADAGAAAKNADAKTAGGVGPSGGRVFDDRRPEHPTPLRHATDGVLLTPDVSYKKAGQPTLSWVFPDQDSVRLRCWTRKPARSRQQAASSSGSSNVHGGGLVTYAACLSRAPTGRAGNVEAGAAGDENGAGLEEDGGGTSSYIEEVTLRAPQWRLHETDLEALAEAEAAEKTRGGGGRPDAGVVADCIFDPAAGVWRVLQFHTRGGADGSGNGADGGGGGGGGGGSSGSDLHSLSTVGEVLAMMQRRAEAITPEEIIPPSHRKPAAGAGAGAAAATTAAAASAAAAAAQVPRSSSASSASSMSSSSQPTAKIAPRSGGGGKTMPSWGPSAKRAAAAAAGAAAGGDGAAGGDDDDAEHPWVALQAPDPRFAQAIAESQHPPPIS